MSRLLTALMSLLLIVALARPAACQIEGLRSRIPDDANAVVILDVEKLFGSPAADRERWEAKRNAAFEAGVTFLSPDTRGVVIAAKLDLEFGKSVWELAMVRIAGDGDIAAIATRYGAEPDMIEGRSAARLPNDSIVVQLNPQMFAAYTPADRQEVARWLRVTDKTSGQTSLSPYLREGFRFVEESGTPIIMAVDLAHALSKERIEARLKESSLAASAGGKMSDFVDTLAGVRGAMIGVTVGEKPYGSIRIDFEGSAAPLADVGKALVIEVLTNQGAMIEDVQQWQASTEGSTLYLRGPLSTPGLRRVLSVLELPPSLGKALDKTQMELAENPESVQRIATQQYYRSVTGLLEDLQKQRKEADRLTAGGVAMWYDKYAKKIDALPILNVDEEMLRYGRDVSGLLRDGENALKSVGMRSSVRTAGNQGPDAYDAYYSDDYRRYGGYRARYAIPYQAARDEGRADAIIRGQERTLGAAQAQAMWQQIETQTAEIRRAMTKKYGVEF